MSSSKSSLKGHGKGFYQGPIRTTWNLLGPHRRVLSLGIGLRMVQAVFTAIPSIVVVWIINRVRLDDLSNRQAWTAILVVTGAAVAQYVFMYASNYFAWVSTFEAMGEARIRMLEHLQRLPLGTMATRSTGDITTVLTTDVDMVSNFAHNAMPIMFGAVVLPLTVFVALLFVDPLLALTVGISVVVAVPLFMLTNNTFKDLALQRGNRVATANSRIVEYIQGVGVARAYGATGERNVLYRQAVADLREINDKMAVRLVPLGIGAIGVVQLGVPLVIAACSYWWFDGRIDAGTVLVFLVLMVRVYAPLLQVGLQIEGFRLADASLERIGKVMDLEPQEVVEEEQVEVVGSSVVFDQVQFGYEPSRPVLTDISFVAEPGSITAIVGPSGVGKSTILNLIARFWDPEVGSVSIGGAEVRHLSRDQLFDSVTAVFQDVYLFQGTIWDNIACGRADVTEAEVTDAARAAQAHDFVSALPDGYETRIGEGGMTLSGGERQRISIARALLKDSPVILLDEATASMDPISEQAVQQGLAKLVANRTLIVVAHRLSTIRSADQIIVLDAGAGEPAQIVQQGTHDELIDVDGLYRALWTERERATRWRAGVLS